MFCFALTAAVSHAATVGTAFTYQGRLSDGGNPANGLYDLQLVLYNAAVGGTQQGPTITTNSVAIVDGLFNITLDFGMGVLDGTAYWLGISVRTNGAGTFAPLAPRQPLQPSPYSFYAINAGSAATANTATTLGGQPVSAFSLAGHVHSGADITSGAVAEPRIDPALARLTQIVPTVLANDGAGSGLDADKLDGLDSAAFSLTTHNHDSNYWKLTGNSGTTPGVNFLGTSDNRPFELRVNNLRAFQLLPARSNDTVNILSGSPLNAIDPGVMAATIAGGGTPDWFGGPRANSIASDFATIGGGADNRIGSNALSAVIAGGFGHRIADGSTDVTVSGGSFSSVSSNTAYATIGGGSRNRIGTNSLSPTINGGFGNRIDDNNVDGAIGGGSINTISSNSFYATIGGGQSNVAGASEATVSGGRFNQALGLSSAIGGGGGNTNYSGWATISGGRANIIASNALYATIGGGVANQTGTNNEATVAGGAFNSALGFSSTVGGGGGNISTGAWSTIPGGLANSALGDYSLAAGRRAKATNQGAFVWADSQNADFSSTVNNQFNVRAAGGARFVTGGAGATVDGAPVLTGTIGPTQIAANAVTSAAIADGSVTSADIANGTISAADVNALGFSTTFWKADGNSGTTAGVHFLGTTDNRSLELRVNNRRALQLLTTRSNDTFNVLAGSPLNYVDPNVMSATISGGGTPDWFGGNRSNSVASDFGTIGGGAGNRVGINSLSATISGGFAHTISDGSYDCTIGGGAFNSIESNSGRSTVNGGFANLVAVSAEGGAIGGGVSNQVAAPYTTIGGGLRNVAGNNEAAVGGGALNTALGFSSAIGGGGVNSAEGQYATVPGGFANLAAGNHSFAAGLNARATNERAFVWSSYDNPAPSFQPSRFHVLGTNGLSVDYSSQRPDGGGSKWIVIGGVTDFPGTVIQAYNGAKLTEGGVWTDFSDRNGKQNFKPVDSQEILRRVIELPVTTWNYKTEQPSVVHIGPVAQDFHAAFDVGNDDTHIAALDANGVSLAAIQGLNQKLEAELKDKDAEIRELKQTVRELKAWMIRINDKLDGARDD